MKRAKIDGWYQQRSFPHFDLPLDYQSARKVVSDPTRVVAHPFRPFIGYVEKVRRFRPNLPENFDVKERPIKYCSHWDGYIHSYYAKSLSRAYEKFVDDAGLSENVIGYRSGLGSNIDFANDVFSEIRSRKFCVAIAFDIKAFFDSIDHEALQFHMMKVLGFTRLPEDWFKVFRSMTTYSWVDVEDIERHLSIKRQKFTRPICSAVEFRKLREDDASFVKNNKKEVFGIPQGSPLSAVMSNVFMIGFDEAAAAYFESIGAYFRRYSDDIIVVCDCLQEAAVMSFVEAKIHALGSAIEISKEKTEIAHFDSDLSGKITCDRPLTYLGFTFDGSRILLRDRTLSRYYRRMTYAGRRAANAAKRLGSKVVYKRKLISQFTHLGPSNFYTYAKRASVKFMDNSPKRQLRKHFRNLMKKSKPRRP